MTSGFNTGYFNLPQPWYVSPTYRQSFPQPGTVSIGDVSGTTKIEDNSACFVPVVLKATLFAGDTSAYMTLYDFADTIELEELIPQEQ